MNFNLVAGNFRKFAEDRSRGYFRSRRCILERPCSVLFQWKGAAMNCHNPIHAAADIISQ